MSGEFQGVMIAHAGRIVAHVVRRLLCFQGAVLQRESRLREESDVEHRPRHDAVAHARDEDASVVRFGFGKRVTARPDLFGKALQIGQAPFGAELRPGRKRTLCRSSTAAATVSGLALRHLSEHGAVDRREDLEVRCLGEAFAVHVVPRAPRGR